MSITKIDEDLWMVSGYGVFEIKDKLKSLGCIWSKDRKGWMFGKSNPNRKQIEKCVNDLKEQKEEKSKKAWSEALLACNLKFVKKGTEDYDRVLDAFKTIVSV